METSATSQAKPDPKVFVSYGHVDDELPPGTQANSKGFVSYLVGQLRYELQQLGLARGVAWLDRYKLRSGDNFVQIITEELARSDILLAIVSNNFLQSDFCRDEVSLFLQRSREKRIFRVDKQQVANDLLPPELRDVHAVPFYARDPEGGLVELYWRGRPTRKKPLEIAVKKLADDIFARLMELRPIVVSDSDRSALTNPILTDAVGKRALAETAPPSTRTPLPVRPLIPVPRSAPVRTIFVAKPAFDLSDPYQSLVHELQGRNIAVVPDPEQEIPTEGKAALGFIRDALAKADASIHLLGERRGFQPEGLTQGIVALQLAAARAVAVQSRQFQRLIWAPSVVPGSDGNAVERDPAEVVEQLDSQTDNDEIFGDTAARFTDFLLQRLLPKAPPGPAAARRVPSVYVAASAADRDSAIQTAKVLKAIGAKPTIALLNGAFKGALACDQIMLCWGSAGDDEMMHALDAANRQILTKPEYPGKLCLLVFPPDSDSKQLAIEVESFGAADLIIDARQPLQNAGLAAVLDDGS